MFCYQPNFFSPTKIVDLTLFQRALIDDGVNRRIREIREWRRKAHDAEVLIAANPYKEATMNDELEAERKRCLKEADRLKRQLPCYIFQATFDETKSKSGIVGAWRKQSATQLNGLYMLDLDHLEGDVKETAKAIKARADELRLMLIHVTSSGSGLRLVGKADPEVGNIADNQHWLASQLGMTMDESCKDASRLSFCPGFEDLIFIDRDIFNYHNEDFANKYNQIYRGGHSAAVGNLFASDSRSVECAGESSQKVSGQTGHVSVESGDGTALLAGQPGPDETLTYHGVAYEKIATEWFQSVLGGLPKAGDRHRSLFQLACDFRYICDADPTLLARVLSQLPVGQEILNERGQSELNRIAADASQKPLYRAIPKRLQRILLAAGVQQDGPDADGESQKASAIDYQSWAERLGRLLDDSPGYREAVADLPAAHKMAGVLAAGAMMGTYLTRCWWPHFDGKDYRLSFIVYIIGDAASGKSFAVQMDKLLMAPMRAADNVGREWERQYKEDMKKRAASSKNARSEAPEQKHPVIRYVPSTISNAMLYRRLTDAVDDQHQDADGQTLHLHCYTFEPELATALRAQTGSWAGKLDLECKSFQNELAGVDYANDQSVNGIIQVNWNQVITGTPDALRRKIRPSTVLDGLVTRLCIFPMPSNDYAMIDRRRVVRDQERECYLRSLGLKLEQVCGELSGKGVEKLVDYCYKYEAELTEQARLEQDRCLDYFRKRIPLIMMRYTLVRMVMRQLDAAIKGDNLVSDDSDLEFARLIGDFCLMSQMHFFGEMVMQALDAQAQDFEPRRRSTKVREAYNQLPDEFRTEDVMQMLGLKSLSGAGQTCRRWVADGIISAPKDRKYKKIKKQLTL